MTFTGSDAIVLSDHAATYDRQLAASVVLAWELRHRPGTDSWLTDLLRDEIPGCALDLGSTFGVDVSIPATAEGEELVVTVDGEWEQVLDLVAAAEELAGNPEAHRLGSIPEPDPTYLQEY